MALKIELVCISFFVMYYPYTTTYDFDFVLNSEFGVIEGVF